MESIKLGMKKPTTPATTNERTIKGQETLAKNYYDKLKNIRNTNFNLGSNQTTYIS